MSLTRFSVPPLYQVTRDLAAVAQGKLAPDLVITGARILSTYSERFFADRQIWIKHGRIVAVKPLDAPTPFPSAPSYDAKGGIMAPGLIDAHLHIESSMVSACAYAEGALLNGTTTIFCDSHEIGNVLGQDGIAMMLEDARQAPLSIFLTVPSTIPATHPGLETAGGDLTPERVGALFDQWPEAVALGEKMDFVAVCEGDERCHGLIAAALKRGRPVCGHLYGRNNVGAYAASGVTDTHEAIDPDIANDLIEAGVWVFLRGGPPGSPWNSLPGAIRAITELGAHPKRFCLCTDDRDADDLLLFGMDYVLQCAIKNGLAPAAAWSLGSLHAAQRYAMDGEIGGLGGGRRADLVLLNDDMAVVNTWYGGELLVEDKKITTQLDQALSTRYSYPKRALETISLSNAKPDLLPKMPSSANRVHVIGAVPGAITTSHEVHDLLSGESIEQLVSRLGLVYMAVLERHGKNGNIGRGFLRHFGLKAGAVASSVGHDAHNLIVAGTNLPDMQLAIATLHENQGGVVIVEEGKVTALVELPVAGLLSQERLPLVAEKMSRLKKRWVQVGCTLPYMGFNLLPLSVIPDFRLTDCGLVDVGTASQVPLFE